MTEVRPDSRSQTQAERKTYDPPQIYLLGNLADLTRGNNPGTKKDTLSAIGS